MDRKTLLAMILCFLIFMGWQKFYIEPRMPKPNQAVLENSSERNAGVPAKTGAEKAETVSAAPAKSPKQDAPLISKPVNVGTGVASVSNANGIFSDWSLKSYRLGIAPEAALVGMSYVTEQKSEGELAFDHPDLAYLTSVKGDLVETPEGAVWTYEDENLKIVRETKGSATLPYVDVKITANFKKTQPKYAFLSLTGQSPENDSQEADRKLVYFTKQSVESVSLTSVETLEIGTPVKWIGTAGRYFLMTLVAVEPTEPRALIQPVAARTGRISLVYPVAGNSITIPLKAYFGPKELDVLRSVEPTLDHTVDFGWFTAFAYPLLKFMKWLYSIFHNYGVAIILLTIAVKIATYPLTYKSMKSMKQMSKLQPQLQKIREKHKDDKEALNREMMSMMKSHGYNPAAGCLPILIQMPVFFALYRVLYSSIELYHAPFALWIHDLSEKDPYYVTPVLLTLTMYIQQKLTPNTTVDPAQQKMLQFMPIMFGAFMLTLPSGLTIYMLTNAIASIIQQMILNKKLDIGPQNASPVPATR
jgi:YidC/Oxa1 family membrane protein insertase